jgi:ribose-phosphate pyrophosphokinase
MLKIVKALIPNILSLDNQTFLFPAGEVGVKLNTTNFAYFWNAAKKQTIVARLQNSNDFMELALTKNALEELDETPINLFVPYIPYGRQDRVCVKGESFSLKVMGRLINSLGFNKVITFDPHSNVTEAVLDRVKIITQFDIIHRFNAFKNLAAGCLLVSPDAGSNKKVSEIAGYFSHKEFLRADKLRDLSNGKILETVVYCDDLKGKNVVIIDDLCEKGGTFMALAKALKAKNCGKVILYVTHGIFSGDINLLYQNGIDEIYTTDSYRTDLVENEKFHILKLEEAFKELL